MKVYQLLELLEGYDEDAEVLFVGQPNWPFEYSIASSVLSREEFMRYEDESDSEEPTEGSKPNDVLLREGTQLRYGNKGLWNY